MTSYPPLYHQLIQYLRQYSHYSDKRHLMTLSWMVMAVLLSQSLHLTEWEPYVMSRATKAQSYQKRWGRFLKNQRIEVEKIYIPLVMAAISKWSQERIYIALDTTMLLNRLYLVVAIAILYGTVAGTTVQLSGLRQQVDVHYSRGLSYLKIGLRWLRGSIHKGRELLQLLPLPYLDPQRCFASRRAESDYYEQLLFSRVRSLHCAKLH